MFSCVPNDLFLPWPISWSALLKRSLSAHNTRQMTQLQNHQQTETDGQRWADTPEKEWHAGGFRKLDSLLATGNDRWAMKTNKNPLRAGNVLCYGRMDQLVAMVVYYNWPYHLPLSLTTADDPLECSGILPPILPVGYSIVDWLVVVPGQ